MTKQKDKKGLLKPNKLIEVAGIRVSTLKYYSELGILPFEQAGKGLMKRYDKEKALKRLKEIANLKKKGLTIPEIVEYFRKNKK